ncbi:MAG TPA: hypothetical protein VK174_00600 [Chitinophagales bacterium]|nr:hypothetical protein [Chitinophagales bacterium]
MKFKIGDFVGLAVSPHKPKMQITKIENETYFCFWVDIDKSGRRIERTGNYSEVQIVRHVPQSRVVRLVSFHKGL